MPLYEYRCPDCDERVELFQRMGENGSVLECPKCRRSGLERIHSRFASASGGAIRSGGGCATGSRFT